MTKLSALDLDRPAASIREAAGLTPTELAAALEVARPTVYDYERSGPAASIRVLRKIAEAAGFELLVVILEKNDKPPLA